MIETRIRARYKLVYELVYNMKPVIEIGIGWKLGTITRKGIAMQFGMGSNIKPASLSIVRVEQIPTETVWHFSKVETLLNFNREIYLFILFSAMLGAFFLNLNTSEESLTSI